MTRTTKRQRKTPLKRQKSSKAVAPTETTGLESTPENEERTAARVAAQKVFAVVELLEEILTYLPMKDLLLNQRVSKTWQNTVTGSPKLQRALFFLPAGEGMVRADKDDVLVYVTEEIIKNWNSGRHEQGTSIIEQVLRQTYINPLLKSLFGTKVLVQEAVSGKLKHSASRKGRRKEASWRRMLTFQPPLESLMDIPEGIRQRTDTNLWEWSEGSAKRREYWCQVGLELAMKFAREYTCAKDLEHIKKQDMEE